jgi:hypothetical protein
MATQVQFRRGTTSQNNAFIGAQGELTVDTDVWALRIHDGVLAGGHVVPTLTATQTFTNKTMSTASVWNGTTISLAYGGTGANLTGVAGAVVYSTGSSMALSLAGTGGQVLTSGGTDGPTWVNSSALSVGTSVVATTSTNVAGGSAGYMVYQQDTDLTGFIAPGVAYQLFQSNGASAIPTWVDSLQNLSLVAISGTDNATDDESGVLTVAGGVGIKKDVYIGGNLIVNGSTTTINSTTLTVDDKNIELGSGQAPTDITANGGGITLKGDTDKTIIWDNDQDNWTSSEHWNIASGKSFKINQIPVLQSATLFGDASQTSITLGVYATSTTIGNATASTLTVNPGTVVGYNTTQNVFNTVATTVNAFGAATTLSLGASTGTAAINNTTVTLGNATTLNINGASPTIASSSTGTLTLFNTNLVTVNAFGAATTIGVGASTGKTTFNSADDASSNTSGALTVVGGVSIQKKLYVGSDTVLTGDLQVKGGDITTNQTTFNLLNDTATTLNIGGASTSTNIGSVSSGTTTIGYDANIKHDLVVDGDVQIKGGDITTNQTTFNLLNDTATTLNIGGAATTISIGSTAHTGTTTINNDLSVYGTITFSQGSSSLSSTTIQIDDTLISLSDNNTADILDIGFYAGYRQSSTDYHTGLVRDASDSGTWKLFSGVSAQPTGTVDFTSATYDTLKLAKVVLTDTSTPITLTGSTSGTTVVKASATASGTLTLPAATDTLVGKATTDTLTNKSISLTNNTITFTSAELKTACSDETGSGVLVFATSPTFTTSIILNGTSSGTTAVQASSSASGTLTLPAATDTLVGKATTDTLTNKSIDLANNTFTATSAQLRTAVSDETGSGVLVFGTSPTITTSLITDSTTFALANTTATTINFAGAATTLNIGAASGATTNLNGILAIKGSSSGSVKLQAAASAGSATYTLPNSAPAADGYALVSTASGTMSWAQAHSGSSGDYQFNSIGVGTAASTTAGEIRATNQITSYYSDDRLKTRGANIENALDKVLALNGFHYTANETAQALGFVAKPEVGLSAQEVQAVLPEVVVDAPVDSQYLTIHYERMIPLLVEAIKAQQKQIEELKAKLGN